MSYAWLFWAESASVPYDDDRQQACLVTVPSPTIVRQAAVLDWNVNAIALYDSVGGRPQTEWITYRVSGPELSALAAES